MILWLLLDPLGKILTQSFGITHILELMDLVHNMGSVQGQRGVKPGTLKFLFIDKMWHIFRSDFRGKTRKRTKLEHSSFQKKKNKMKGKIKDLWSQLIGRPY